MIQSTETLGFLTPDIIEVFEGCFDFREISIPPGARYDTSGRIAYLLKGEGEIGAWDLEHDEFFGLSREGEPERQVFTSHTTCTILLWNSDVMTRVCYRQCWFHLKLLDEIKKSLEKRFYRIGE